MSDICWFLTEYEDDLPSWFHIISVNQISKRVFGLRVISERYCDAIMIKCLINECGELEWKVV